MLDMFRERSNIRNILSHKMIDFRIGDWVQMYSDKLLLFPKEDCLQQFTWNQVRRTRYIESLLLGIPQTPIVDLEYESGSFFYIIDGVQRLTTIFQFLGVMKSKNGTMIKPSKLYYPAIVQKLEGVGVNDLSKNDYSNLLFTLLPALQLSFEPALQLSSDVDINKLINLFGCA